VTTIDDVPSAKEEGAGRETEWHAASYLAGYRRALTEGYQLGHVDVERAKSEAAADGYRRGRDFTMTTRSDNHTGAYIALGFALTFVLAVRVRRLQDALEEVQEVAGRELSDVRN